MALAFKQDSQKLITIAKTNQSSLLYIYTLGAAAGLHFCWENK